MSARAPSLRRWQLMVCLIVAVLVPALVAGPMLGAMHRVLHAPGLAGHTTTAHADGHHTGHPQDHAHDHSLPGIAALFGEHADDTSCRLLDQLAGPDTLPMAHAMAVLSSVVAGAAMRWLDAVFRARESALFEARGPPGC